MKRVVAIFGSPRREGNTALLLQEAVRGAREAEVEEVVLRDLKMSLCLEIYECKNSGRRAIQDDFQKVYETGPLDRPRCRNRMRVIASIEHPKVIRRIPKHPGLWSPTFGPKAHSPPVQPAPFEAFFSQLPALEEDFSPVPPGHWEC